MCPVSLRGALAGVPILELRRVPKKVGFYPFFPKMGMPRWALNIP